MRNTLKNGWTDLCRINPGPRIDPFTSHAQINITSLKIKFVFKMKVWPSHPSCNHLCQRIKLSLNFHFPMHWDWLKWFQFWKSWKSWHYWTYCHFCLMSVYDYWNLFQIDLHIMCTSGYIFVCKFWEAYLDFFMSIYAVSLGSSSFIFVD